MYHLQIKYTYCAYTKYCKQWIVFPVVSCFWCGNFHWTHLLINSCSKDHLNLFNWVKHPTIIIRGFTDIISHLIYSLGIFSGSVVILWTMNIWKTSNASVCSAGVLLPFNTILTTFWLSVHHLTCLLLSRVAKDQGTVRTALSWCHVELWHSSQFDYWLCATWRPCSTAYSSKMYH